MPPVPRRSLIRGRGLSPCGGAIESYIQRVRGAHPSPEEVETVFKDFVSGQERYLESFSKELREAERKEAIALFEDAERELLTLRDEALTEETQAAFGSRFWDDDDDG